MILFVPCDVMRPRRVDEHFAAEAEAARAAGVEVVVVDHDALARPDGAERAVSRVSAVGDAVYRGWMLRSEQYAAFDRALRARGVRLRTGHAQYRQAHELPGWYAALAEVTPRSAWTDGRDRAAFDRACGELGAGPAVLRDYTKSMKHYWHEAAFIPDVADTDRAWTVASRLHTLRDDDFVGGFVVRRFDRFVSAEVRTWWVKGACTLISPHPDTPDDLPAADVDLTAIAPLIASLNLPFVTVDLAQRDDRAWRVVELGDGQVSDRPGTINPDEFIDLLVSGLARSTSGSPVEAVGGLPLPAEGGDLGC